MSMEKMRDSIDFKNTDIKTLFRKLLLPTVLGMIFSALFRYQPTASLSEKESAVMLGGGQHCGTAMVVFYGCGTYVRRRRSVVAPFICHTERSRWHASISRSR